MSNNHLTPKRGEIWFANLGALNPAAGSEIQKSRPVLIVGNNIINERRRTALVIPLATSGGKAIASPPITVSVNCAGKKGVGVIDQLRALDKNRLVKLLDVMQPDEFQSVINALSQVLEMS